MVFYSYFQSIVTYGLVLHISEIVWYFSQLLTVKVIYASMYHIGMEQVKSLIFKIDFYTIFFKWLPYHSWKSYPTQLFHSL